PGWMPGVPADTRGGSRAAAREHRSRPTGTTPRAGWRVAPEGARLPLARSRPGGSGRAMTRTPRPPPGAHPAAADTQSPGPGYAAPPARWRWACWLAGTRRHWGRDPRRRERWS